VQTLPLLFLFLFLLLVVVEVLLEDLTFEVLDVLKVVGDVRVLLQFHLDCTFYHFVQVFLFLFRVFLGHFGEVQIGHFLVLLLGLEDFDHVGVDGAVGLQHVRGACERGFVPFECLQFGFKFRRPTVLFLEVIDFVDELLDVSALAVLVFLELVILFLLLGLLLFKFFKTDGTILLLCQQLFVHFLGFGVCILLNLQFV